MEEGEEEGWGCGLDRGRGLVTCALAGGAMARPTSVGLPLKVVQLARLPGHAAAPCGSEEEDGELREGDSRVRSERGSDQVWRFGWDADAVLFGWGRFQEGREEGGGYVMACLGYAPHRPPAGHRCCQCPPALPTPR